MTRLLCLLLSVPLVAKANLTVPAGHQLEIDFTLIGGAAATTNGISLSGTIGTSTSGSFDIRSTILDDTQPLGPQSTQPALPNRWVLTSNNHLQPHFPLDSVAPVIDGSIQGRIIIENLSTDEDDSFTFLGNLILRAAQFNSNGGFSQTAQFTITRAEVVESVSEPAVPEITNFEKLSGSVNLSWSSENGVSYRVERSETLGSWQTVATEVASGPLTTRSYAEITPPGGRAFFRVVRLP